MLFRSIKIKGKKEDDCFVLYKDGHWNCCTVLPYTEYRVRKVTAEQVITYPGSGHNYDVTVYLEHPLQNIIEESWNEGVMYTIRCRIPRAVVRAIKHIFLGIAQNAVYGWKQGWYNWR